MPEIDPQQLGVTHGEIVRGLRELREEIRALRGEHVRRDLYEAHRAVANADIARLDARLDEQDKERAAYRRQITLAVIAAMLSLLVQLLLVVLRT
jgi:hypothetical protein